jgi:hypothetical protein
MTEDDLLDVWRQEQPEQPTDLTVAAVADIRVNHT